MISIIHESSENRIVIFFDESGADLLIQKLQNLKSRGGHLHFYGSDDDRGGLSLVSPYGQPSAVGELELNILDPEAWTGG